MKINEEKNNLIELKKMLLDCNFSEEKLNYIMKNFGNTKGYQERYLRQIHSSLGMLDSTEDEYQRGFEMLKDNFDLRCNILEVDGGHYPVLAKKIDQYQVENSKGTITVYDPDLVVSKLGNIKLVKNKFTYGDDISKYDLIIAQNPREDLEDVLAAALQSDKELFVETAYPWGLERFESSKYDVYEDDGYAIIIGALHDYMLSICKDVKSYSKPDGCCSKTYFIRTKKK